MASAYTRGTPCDSILNLDDRKDLTQSSKGIVKKLIKLFKKGNIRRGITKEIEDIKDRIKEVAERRGRYNISTFIPATTMVDTCLTAYYTKETDLIGMDEAVGDLIRRFTNGDGMSAQQQMVVSIVGFGGLGKTTLAKAVYDKLKRQFDCTAFVSVSRNPEMKKIFKNILYELDKAMHKNIYNAAWDEKQLIDQIREYLQGKRYLIVIDDIWDTISWTTIRFALDDNNSGSRIITTTRNNNVAERVGGSYILKPLNEESSKQLFYQRIFGSEDKCPVQFLEVSKNILKKYGGVPLAIITISCLLDNITEWHKVCDYVGTGLENNPDMNGMRKILSLSYYDLPSDLKRCLLYLSLFPEDYEIRRDRLIWRWISEDFVQHEEKGNSIFELGDSYFVELINRSMIQPVDIDEQGQARACRMHDMVLDLTCSLSRGENFVNISNCSEHTTFWTTKVRWLSLQENTGINMSMAQVRSFSIFSPAIHDSMPSLSRFHILRVLDLEGCDLKECGHLNLRYIGNLIHLRYLSLRHTFLDELPEEIGKLHFLQTLDLIRTLAEELPSSIVRLSQLMCLSVNYTTRMPTGLANMTSLEVLETVRVDEDSINLVKQLGHLSQLRALRIDFNMKTWDGLDESVGKALMESLHDLRKLQSLEITDFYGRDDSVEGGCTLPPRLRRFVLWTASSLPIWIKPSSLLLSHLDIEVNKLQVGDIQILGMLPALRHLWLGESGRIQERPMEKFVVNADVFPCARVCKFFNFVMVPSMFPQGAMPSIEHLEFCLQLSNITNSDFVFVDLNMGHLPSLKHVVVNLYSKQEDSKEELMKLERR